MDGLRLAAEISGVILAVVAIILSIKFFQLSELSARRLDDTARSIELAVTRLEPVLAQLYSDAFGLVKDTMTDLRAHAWDEKPAQPDVTVQVEERAAAKVQELKVELGSRIEQLAIQMQRTEGGRPEIDQQLSEVLDTAIERSRNVDAEARSETLHSEVRRMYSLLSNGNAPVKAIELIRSLIPPFNFGDLAEEILALRREGILFWSGDLAPDSIVTLAESDR